MKLDKNAFIALAAVVWADGEAAPTEAAALLKAATAWGVAGDELAEVERALETRLPLSKLAELGLTGDGRLLVYSIAAWLTQADGVVVPRESEILEQLAGLLGLSADEREHCTTQPMIAASFIAGSSGRCDVLAIAREIEALAKHGLEDTLKLDG